MSNKGAYFYLKAILKVIRKVIVTLLSWLLELCGGNANPINYDTSHESSVRPLTSNQEYEQKIKAMQTQISKLNQMVNNLNQKLELTQDEVVDLRKRLNSMTGEFLDDMEKMRNELLTYMNTEIEKLLNKTSYAKEPEVPRQESPMLYFESSSDGKMLINMTRENTVSSNFIELSPTNGLFSIVQTEKCVEYVLANRDYALEACEVHVDSASPSSIRVDEYGVAGRINNSNDWKVIRKAKITLL